MKYNPKIHHRRSIRLKGYDYSQTGLYFITINVQHRACLFGEIVNGEMVLNEAGKMIEKWYYELENKFADIKCGSMVIMPNHFHCIIENIGGNGGNGKHVGLGENVRLGEQGEHKGLGENIRLGEQGEHIGLGENIRLGDQSEHIGLGEQGEHLGLGENIRLGDQSEHLGLVEQGEHIGLGEQGGHIGLGENIRLGDQGEHLGLGEQGEHIGSPVRAVVGWFKTMTTNAYIRGVKQLGWPPFDGKLWQRNYYEHIIRNERSYQNISNYIINNPAHWKDDHTG